MRSKPPRCGDRFYRSVDFRCARCGYGAGLGLTERRSCGARCVHGEFVGIQHHVARNFAALDASRADAAVGRFAITVTSAFERLFIDLSIVAVEPAAVGFDYDVIHNVVVGGDGDFAGGSIA